MKIIIIPILLVFLLPVLAIADENKLYLVCKIETRPNETRSMTFVIDFENQTVLGSPATISDTMISYEKGVNKVMIDRFSGSITIIARGECIRGSDCRYNGICTRQQSKQF